MFAPTNAANANNGNNYYVSLRVLGAIVTARNPRLPLSLLYNPKRVVAVNIFVIASSYAGAEGF